MDNERYIKAFWDTTVETGRPYREDTARFEAFGQEPVNIGMSGLFGCTAFIAVSRRGAYVAHWWEHPDFDNGNRLRAGALKGLKEGLQFHPSLVRYANELRGASAFLMIPATGDAANPIPIYPAEVDLIKKTVHDILHDVTVHTFPYLPVPKGDDLDLEESISNLKGICMVQYKPATAAEGLCHKVSVQTKSVELAWS